jgi:hemerythrin superfamily protein
MPTTAQPAKTTKAKTASTAKGPDAVALLKADHREVEGLFAQFEKAKADSQKVKIAGKICDALTVHAQIEEEIFYPESRAFLKDDEIVNEAEVEHGSAKEMIAQIQAGQPSDQHWEAKVTWLMEIIKHHVEEEEKEYFPQTKKTDMDMKAVGARMAARKAELMAAMGKPVH